MASSSKTINMPLLFAISIGASVALVATTMFALAWYKYEAKVVLRDQVLEGPTHDDHYDKALAEQQANLGDIDQAMKAVAAEHGPADQQGHGGHGGDADHGGGE